MMKDIQLKTNGYGKYDWSFNGLDVNTITGRRQLIQSVKHAVLLRHGELVQSLYNDKGSHVHEYIYTDNHPNDLAQKEAAVEEACKSVYNISTAQCTILDLEDEYADRIQIELITDQLEVVTINEV